MTPSFENLKDRCGIDIGARLWRGLVSVDLLIRMACEIRPYELEPATKQQNGKMRMPR